MSLSTEEFTAILNLAAKAQVPVGEILVLAPVIQRAVDLVNTKASIGALKSEPLPVLTPPWEEIASGSQEIL